MEVCSWKNQPEFEVWSSWCWDVDLYRFLRSLPINEKIFKFFAKTIADGSFFTEVFLEVCSWKKHSEFKILSSWYWDVDLYQFCRNFLTNENIFWFQNLKNCHGSLWSFSWKFVVERSSQNLNYQTVQVGMLTFTESLKKILEK